MMEGDDIIIRKFLIFSIEGVDEMDIFGNRRNDDDIIADKVLLLQSLAEELRIKFEGIGHESLSQWIRFDDIKFFVSILDDTVIFVHLFQGTESEV